jgi:hypothetical protein
MQNFSETPKAQNIFSIVYIDVYVVFVVIFTDPTRVCVCVEGQKGEDDTLPGPPPQTGSFIIYVKTTVHCSPGFSMICAKKQIEVVL